MWAIQEKGEFDMEGETDARVDMHTHTHTHTHWLWWTAVSCSMSAGNPMLKRADVRLHIGADAM